TFSVSLHRVGSPVGVESPGAWTWPLPDGPRNWGQALLSAVAAVVSRNDNPAWKRYFNESMSASLDSVGERGVRVSLYNSDCRPSGNAKASAIGRRQSYAEAAVSLSCPPPDGTFFLPPCPV